MRPPARTERRSRYRCASAFRSAQDSAAARPTRPRCCAPQFDGGLGAVAAKDWLAVARALGSDIPFFLTGTGALVEGTGERVTALGALPPWWVVVLAPDVHVDTGDAYRRLAAARAQTPAQVRPRTGSASVRALEAVQRADFAGAVAAATNDFEPLIAAAYAPVKGALQALRDAGAGRAMLSGSGGSTFALCEREDAARTLAAAIALPERARLFVVLAARGHLLWRGAHRARPFEGLRTGNERDRPRRRRAGCGVGHRRRLAEQGVRRDRRHRSGRARHRLALRATPGIGRIIVVAPAETHGRAALADADERRVDGARMVESLESGLAGLPPDELTLIAASDLPILTAEAIAEFLAAAQTRDLDLAYAIVSQRVHCAAFPQVPHTWAKMVEGRFCGGGLVALKPRVLPALQAVLDGLGAARKSPFRLAALLGWDILPRFALGSLTVEAAERRAGAILQAPAGAVVCSHPEVAVNVDRVSDIGLANGLVGAAAKRAGRGAAIGIEERSPSL